MKPSASIKRALNPLKTLLVLPALLTLAACGSQSEPALPDDPTSEPPALEAPAPDTALKDDPSSEPTPPSASLPDASSPDTSSPDTEDTLNPDATTKAEESRILDKYNHVDPNRVIQDKHLSAALIYFDKNKAKIKNQKYLSVIDFSKSSKYPRFFIIDMGTGSVWAIRTAHGKGSDADRDGYAEKFSNVSGSNASSLGFYLTAETYNGSNGYSLRLDGLSSTNSKARARAVVIHGADYVQESNIIQGRSWGCPAIAQKNRDKVINMIKNGSLIYAGK